MPTTRARVIAAYVLAAAIAAIVSAGWLYYRRLKTGILAGGGLFADKVAAEIDILNFASRVRVPVLMLNGRYDFAAPSAILQQPMFRWLGTPERDKRHMQFDTGHFILLQDPIGEVLNWLDRYIGPVDTAR